MRTLEVFNNPHLPKMYCLECSQMPWRTTAVVKRFAAAGLTVEPFEGIHGATVGIAPTLSHFDSPGHNIGTGKLSITISKMLLWQTIINRPEPYALVFENDVTFVPNFADELLKSIDALPHGWQVCHVGHCCGDDKPTKRINDRVSEIRHPFCCHAVLWTKHAARVALSEFRKASWGTPSDIILAKLVYPQLRHYSFTPPLAFQDQSLSEAASTGRWDSIQGWFDFAKVYDETLDRVQASGVPATFVEVGAWKGRSTAYMGEEIKRRMLPVEFYAVDTWKGMEFCGLDEEVKREYGGDLFPTFLRNMSRAGVIDYVQPLQMTSVEAAKTFDNQTVDFCFIDGDHTEQAVLDDIQAWGPKMRPGGVMAGHDIDMEPVRRAVTRLLPKYRRWERCWIAEGR